MVKQLEKRRVVVARKKKNAEILARANLLPEKSWAPVALERPLAKIIPFPTKKVLTFPTARGYVNKEEYLYPLEGLEDEEITDGVIYEF